MSMRPAIRRFAIVAFAILLPVAAHRLWDYIEVRRLVHEIEAIRAKGEPVTEAAAGGGPSLVTEQRSAASYYLAGAALALGTNPYRVLTPIREWLAQPKPDPRALPPLIKPLQQFVDEGRDALALVDKAAGLPFDGFPAGTEFSYRTAGIADLSELNTARAFSLSAAGQADAAVESVIGGLQIRRALRDAGWMISVRSAVPAVLSLSRPSQPALMRLQTALEAEDRPEQSHQTFVRDRARYVELIWRRYYGSEPNAPRSYLLPMRSLTETVMRPWFTHRAVELLRLWAELVEVSKSSWPDKARAGAALLERFRSEESSRPRSYGNPFVNRDRALSSFVRAVDAAPLIVDRSARVAVAVERFMRDRGRLPAALSDLVPAYLSEIPTDPYSGRPLVFRPAAGAYLIYSIGPNQKDDAGDVSYEQRPARRGPDGRILRVADVGIRVLTDSARVSAPAP